MSTTRRIDFFGGTHGNYLELVVNHSIDQNPYDISKSQFTAQGACHNKRDDSTYHAITKANHYSWDDIPVDSNDYIIQITPAQSDLLVAITNSFLRAGDQCLDLDDLEINTAQKISQLPKLQPFLNTLISDHGMREQYPRHILRNYFYSMFEDFENGLKKFVTFRPHPKVYKFDFRNFFSFDRFYQSLQEIARFVELEFTPTQQMIQLHQNFLSVNQGFHSEQKCLVLIEQIIQGEDVDFELNIMEEAWLNYRMSRVFNLFEVPGLNQDIYPTNTLQVQNLIGVPTRTRT